MKYKATIMVIDDTLVSLTLLNDILTKEGYQVHTAGSGELALAAITSNNLPNLILLDIVMPGIDGLEVCRRLKKREDTKNIPIILISAFSDVKEWVEGLRMGASDYITKPFHFEELMTRVKTQLALWQANQSIDQQAAELENTNKKLEIEIEKLRKTEEQLAQKIVDLERLQHFFNYREQRIISLKDEIKELKTRLLINKERKN